MVAEISIRPSRGDTKQLTNERVQSTKGLHGDVDCSLRSGETGQQCETGVRSATSASTDAVVLIFGDVSL